ncbi:unnamed protein product [Amoebophrya sp. A25]|nr:unnamed protein product [Amoebophrya sp. A25]|eukprot:GSA25T00003205001.1
MNNSIINILYTSFDTSTSTTTAPTIPYCDKMAEEKTAVERLLRAEAVPDEQIRLLLDEGYDTRSVLKSMTEQNMEELGLKKGHISKLRLVQQKLGKKTTEKAPAASLTTNPVEYVREYLREYLTLGEAPFCRFCSDSWSVAETNRPEKKQKGAEYTPRGVEEIQKLVQVWQSYAHPRARNFFATTELLEHVLTQVARGVDREDDPILADGDHCIFWYGDVTKDEEAAIRMVKPGEEKESITYVNRVLAFIFATDESFTKLMSLPKTPFKMCCQNQLCINLSHISSSAD